MEKCDLGIVIPCFNEEASLEKTFCTIRESLHSVTEAYEIVVVDDGSTDSTFETVLKARNADSRIRGIRFTRNFGKEAAIYAGLQNARGAAIAILDADCQHPPSLLVEMMKEWRSGKFDIVEAVKSHRGAKNMISGLRSKLFNKIMTTFTGFDMQGASDFKLMDRRVVDLIVRMRENNRLFRGLTKWTGLRTKQIFFEVPERIAGESKWSIFGLLRLSVSAITSFSFIPLNMITTLGGITLLVSFVLIVQTLYNKLSGHAVSGFATVIILNLILNSIVMISLGIIGIYLANVYSELKGRPAYLVAQTTDDRASRFWEGSSIQDEDGGDSREFFRRQLIRRFGYLSPDIDKKLTYSSKEEIERWGENFAAGHELFDIFNLDSSLGCEIKDPGCA